MRTGTGAPFTNSPSSFPQKSLLSGPCALHSDWGVGGGGWPQHFPTVATFGPSYIFLFLPLSFGGTTFLPPALVLWSKCHQFRCSQFSGCGDGSRDGSRVMKWELLLWWPNHEGASLQLWCHVHSCVTEFVCRQVMKSTPRRRAQKGGAGGKESPDETKDLQRCLPGPARRLGGSFLFDSGLPQTATNKSPVCVSYLELGFFHMPFYKGLAWGSGQVLMRDCSSEITPLDSSLLFFTLRGGVKTPPSCGSSELASRPTEV